MNFEISEIVKTDKNKMELVAVLESQFKNVSKSVQRTGDLLLVEYIGNTFGAINRMDASLIKLKENNGGYLLIAEVEYKPSLWFWVFVVLGLFSYVGWIIPIIIYFWHQSIVRKNIQNIFLRVKNEFDNPNIIPKSSNIIESNKNVDDLGRLEKLYELKEKGIITEEEFITMKNDVLKK
jgi:hypothetical protein